jgi:hypothetical protein
VDVLGVLQARARVVLSRRLASAAIEIGIDQAYATTVFETPDDAPTDWLGVPHQPTLPGSSRSGLVMPMEGSRWSVSLCVNHGETPPSDIDGFMAFAKSLRMPKIDVARQHLEDLAFQSPLNRAQAVAVRDVPRPCHAPDTRGG